MRPRALLLLLLTGACGGVQARPTTPVTPLAAAPVAAAPAPTSRCGVVQGMSIEGQMGSLDPARVRRTDPGNPASQRVLERNGFVRDGADDEGLRWRLPLGTRGR